MLASWQQVGQEEQLHALVGVHLLPLELLVPNPQAGFSLETISLSYKA